MNYCHTNASIMRRPSTLENEYSNIFYNTTGPTVLKFHMEHDLTPGSQNCKIGSGRISKMATVTKNSKNNKINFFSRTTGYFWLTFGMEPAIAALHGRHTISHFGHCTVMHCVIGGVSLVDL